MDGLKSAIPELAWPSVMTDHSGLMALLRQYDVSQWWTAEQLMEAQFLQLSKLAEHALRTVPFYGRRLRDVGYVSGMNMTPEIWSRLPILTRDDVRDAEEKLRATSYPKTFGETSWANSGGSTGIPVRVLKTGMDGVMWQAAHLRELEWNGIDFSLEIANLRGAASLMKALSQNPGAIEDSGGLILPDWGHPATLLRKTGRMGLLEPTLPLATQAEYLIKRRPGYLIMRPSGLRLILVYFREMGLTLDSLRSVWTMSESVDESLREVCREIFGCPVKSSYSCNETGYIALQCPSGLNYHAVSESVLVEVIDKQGNPSKPGEIGRVLVTPLHNYAMPLLRYQVGDEAEVGPPCSCGRGLPSLTRIVGRLQDYVTLRSGEKKRVHTGHYRISAIRAVREFQLVQTSLETIELRLVVSRALNEEENKVLEEVMKKSFGGYLKWTIVFVESLPRTSAGKLMQFRSEV